MDDSDLNDPEDDYDASDPPAERLRNFIERLLYVREHFTIGPTLALRDRLDRLVDDIETLRSETP